MAQPLLDQILKAMAERRPKPFVCMAFQKKDFRVISSKYDTELIIRTRRVDKVIHIKDEDGEHLINYEFQSRYRQPIGKRLFVYAGALTATHNLEVSSVLFLLRPPPRNVDTVGRYEVKLLQPELIDLEKNLKHRDELLGFSLLLAKRHFARELVREIFKQEEKNMDIIWEDVPFIGERIIEVKAEGKAEGKAEALQKVILKVLATRFNVANGRVSRLVNSVHDPQKLEVIMDRALKAKTLDTVVDMLQKAKPPAKRKATK